MSDVVQFIVTVQVDQAAIEYEAKRRGRPLPVARNEVIADLECLLFDSIRHRDGVDRVGVTIVQDTAGAPGAVETKAGGTVAG